MMNERDRQILQSPLYQGEDEVISYLLTTTPWSSNPGSISVKLYRIRGDDQIDISTTNLSGTASVMGDVITTPFVIGLIAGKKYRLDIKWTSSGLTFKAFSTIIGQI